MPTRRDVLKASLFAPAAVAAAKTINPFYVASNATAVTSHAAEENPISSQPTSAGRERLLLDFGWRFHFGHADDPSTDFGFGGSTWGNFQKTGNFMPAGALAFDDGDWRSLDLPHDWAVELPFQNDPDLLNKGFYPLGRKYPATSVGWYRRVFELSPDDAGKRITIEFDGAYRETMVVLNGFYIGRHSGGYDPFSFNVSDFAYVGQRNVLLVRVDATQSDGWFYEGAGIYRHVWLVKNNPLHVEQWGTFVKSHLRSSEASLSILTEVSNHGSASRDARVISTIVDPSGQTVGKSSAPSATIASGADLAAGYLACTSRRSRDSAELCSKRLRVAALFWTYPSHSVPSCMCLFDPWSK
jgi:beta-galactosidase